MIRSDGSNADEAVVLIHLLLPYSNKLIRNSMEDYNMLIYTDYLLLTAQINSDRLQASNKHTTAYNYVIAFSL